MQDGKETIVLTPQFSHNYDIASDIFNHRSATYWNLILPGQVGVISNLRASSMYVSITCTISAKPATE